MATTTTLTTTLYDWLSSTDARLLALCSGDSKDSSAHALVAHLDAFFEHATHLQAHREELQSLPRTAASALNEETRLVFLLYMRVLALLRKRTNLESPEPLLLLDSVLHATRIAPFCQLYARNNASSVDQLVSELVTHIDGFAAHVGALRDVYVKHLHTLHAVVQQDKRGQVLELIHSVYEVALSLSGLTSSASLVPLLLLGSGSEPELVFQQPESLMRALVVCYESDVPTLQRHLGKLDAKAQRDKLLIVAETRRLLLQVLARFMELLLTKQSGEGQHDEVLLEALHTASHCCDDDDADQGSYLSDLWHLCGYKDKIASFLESSTTESDHLSYLEMIVDALPRRRIVSTGLSAHYASADTSATAAAAAAASAPVNVSTNEDNEEKHASADTMRALVAQVQDFFPHLGDGYVELCLLSTQHQVDAVVNFVLESNPPPALLDVRQDLARSDPEFAALEAKLNGKPHAATAAAATAVAAVAEPSTTKLDPTRVWVGKKPMEKHYDPQVVRKDAALADKTRAIAAQIVEEEELMAGVTPFLKLDEYDDDYNDEFEDYEPFSVHDGGQTDDQDAVRTQNRLMLAREAEDAYWESMRNRNHEQPARHGDAIDEDAERKLVPNAARAAPRRAMPTAAPTAQQSKQSKQSKQQPGASKDAGSSQQHWKKAPADADDDTSAAPSRTKEQELRARARSAKNKAKVANHHRKDRALKKQG